MNIMNMNKYYYLVKINGGSRRFFLGLYGKKKTLIDIELRNKGYEIIGQPIKSNRINEIIVLDYQSIRSKFLLSLENYKWLLQNWKEIRFQNVEDLLNFNLTHNDIESVYQKIK